MQPARGFDSDKSWFQANIRLVKITIQLKSTVLKSLKSSMETFGGSADALLSHSAVYVTPPRMCQRQDTWLLELFVYFLTRSRSVLHNYFH